jgi:sec-independent protein translocase protein TatA
MLPHLGLPELLLILLIVVLLFGVNKLPRLGRGIGEGIRNFKESLRSGGSEPGSTGDDGGGGNNSDASQRNR